MVLKQIDCEFVIDVIQMYGMVFVLEQSKVEHFRQHIKINQLAVHVVRRYAYTRE